MRDGEEGGNLIDMHGARCLLVVAIYSSACFMDQPTMGNEDDGGDSEAESTTTATGGSTDAEPTTSASTSSTTMDQTTTSTTDDTITDSAPTDSTPTITDTMPADCGLGEVCLPIADGEWMGPLVAHFVPPNTPPSDCPLGWAMGPTGFLDLQTPPFECECACLQLPDVTCAFDFAFNAGDQCDGITQASVSGGIGDCVAYADGGVRSVLVSDVSSEADCGGASWSAPSPSTWTERIDACVPPPGETCSLGACVPRPPMTFEGPVCIARDGEHDCPEGPFDTRHVVYAGYDDTRTCDCECTANDVSCGGLVVASGAESCADDIGSNGVGGCVTAGSDIHSASVSTAVGSAECVALGEATPEGAVTRNGPRTFCCAAP
jgi:hypothetical protein